MPKTKSQAPRIRVIDRIRARAEWAAWRRQGRRVVELRGKRCLQRLRYGMRPVTHLEIPVVFIGDEAAQRAVIKRNPRLLRQP